MNRPTTPRGPVPSGPRTVISRDTWTHDGRRGYGLAVLVAVIGAMAAGLWAVTGYMDQVQRPDRFVRTEVPGVMDVAITQPGSHVVYVEGAGPAQLGAADLTVISPQGATIAARPYSADLRYDVPGASGQLGTAVAIFDADRTGTYEVSTQALSADRTTRLAVGDDLAPAAIRTVTVPSAVGVLVVLAGFGLALATWIHDERRNHS